MLFSLSLWERVGEWARINALGEGWGVGAH